MDNLFDNLSWIMLAFHPCIAALLGIRFNERVDEAENLRSN
jgi:hypothetical protein